MLTDLAHFRRNRGGFTLVEIMCIVAIIALLGVLSLPVFLRARKRSQATIVLNDARLLDGAKDQYAAAGNAPPGATVAAEIFTGYLRPGTRLYALCDAGAAPTDILGNPYVLTTFSDSIKISSDTLVSFSDVISDPAAFWAGYQ